MFLNLDSAIFATFIALNLIFGLIFSRGVKTMKEYAVGTGNFSTLTIAATLVATWISGETFVTYLDESYKHGLYFIFASLGDVILLLIMGYVFGPRMGEFIGKLSIADCMGELYGKKVRIITALAGCLGAGGVIAVQLKVAGMLLEYCFNIPVEYGIIISAVIISLYSSLGGIKSVTLTDVIQLFTFGTIIPTLAFFIFSSLDSVDLITNNLKNNPVFDFKEIFNPSNPKALHYVLLFVFLSIPAFSPSLSQRILMSKNTLQIRKSFRIAAFSCLAITLTMSFIGVLLYSADPNIDSHNILKHVLTNYSYPGLMGLTLTGIMAMVMSTADSYINSTAVILVYDLCKPLGVKLFKDELILTRLASFLITIIALVLTNVSENLLQILLTMMSFYMPVVTIPFMMAVFGFRTSSKSVLISMASGLASVFLMQIILNIDVMVSGLVSMLINLVFLMGSHYLLKQPGGWVGIKDEGSLRSYQQQRAVGLRNVITSIKSFNLLHFLNKSTSRNESTYISLGLFCIISTYMNVFSMPKDLALKYSDLIGYLYPSMLFLATALFSFPLWPKFLKITSAIIWIWNVVIFYNLVCCSFAFTVLSNFSSIQITVFMVNLMLLSLLLNWKLVISMIFVGAVLTIQGLKIYLGIDILSIPDLDFKISYILFITSGILVVFLKPRQEEFELSMVRQEHFDEEMQNKNDEVARSLAIKQEFLNNISHELRTTVTGITSIGKSLFEIYREELSEKLYQPIKIIAESSERLESFISNILDLSNLACVSYQLNYTKVDFSALIYKRIELCKNLYLGNKELEFIIDIADGLIINCDEHYISSTIDNLVINAIKYSDFAKITITLKQKNDQVIFAIKDEGIGIPKNELLTIFDPFVVGSRTYTPAGGRGVGLALCRQAIEKHQGKIWVESEDGQNSKGSTFFVLLPMNLENSSALIN